MLDVRVGGGDPFGLVGAHRSRIGIIGLGYVGLPLAAEFAKTFSTVGFDVDAQRVHSLNAGHSHIGDVPSKTIALLRAGGRFEATDQFDRLGDCDCIVICVPTPLDRSKEPDLSYIVAAGNRIAQTLRKGQLIVLESTTYPGTTEELLLPLFRETGLELDRDFFLAFSPERVDPGNDAFTLSSIPKVVGGCSEESGDLAELLYRQIFGTVHRVSSARVAETSKLLENTFRSVNIGLANEMALMCHRLGISSREVIEAASTKPFGFMAFHPGPGVGGHCIPLDPLYLSWKARQYGFSSRFIDLADEINSGMPEHVVRLAGDALNDVSKPLRGSQILVVGVTYKEDVADVRHSPSLTIIDRLRSVGGVVRYHDPFVPRIDFERADVPAGRAMAPAGPDRRRKRRRAIEAIAPAAATERMGRRRVDPLETVALDDEVLRAADCVIVATAHRDIDYRRIARLARLVIDTRNVVPADETAKVVYL